MEDLQNEEFAIITANRYVELLEYEKFSKQNEIRGLWKSEITETGRVNKIFCLSFKEGDEDLKTFFTENIIPIFEDLHKERNDYFDMYYDMRFKDGEKIKANQLKILGKPTRWWEEKIKKIMNKEI